MTASVRTPAADSEWERIAITRRDGVVELRLHADGGPLVWDARAHFELAEIWNYLAQDPQLRVVLLTGTGQEFCTQIRSPSGERTWYDIWSEGSRIINGYVGLDAMVISVANGPATIHAELLALGDIVLATPTATFADHAHTVRGVVPGDGAQIVWPRLLGESRGRYFLLTGQEIDASEALRLGVVHEIHPPEAVMDRARTLGTALAHLPRAVIAYTRASIRGAERRALADALRSGLALAGIGKAVQAEG